MQTINRKLTAVLAAAAISGLAAPLGATSAAAALPKVGYTAQAFGTQVLVGSVVRSGASAISSIGCTTASGKDVTNSAVGVSLPGVGTVGAVTSSASTRETTTARTSASTAKVNGVNLLDGLVQADAVASSSTASMSAVGTFSGVNTSTLTGLVVGGQPVSASAAPNTKLTLSSGGSPFATVYVNKQERGKVGSEYRVATAAITVIINGDNELDLPIGSRIDVAQSRAYLTDPVVGLVSGRGYATSANLLDGTVTSAPTALAQPRCTGGTTATNAAGSSVPNTVTTGTTTTSTTATVSPTSRSVRVRNDIALPRVLGGLISADAITTFTSASQTAGSAAALKDSSGFTGLKLTGAPDIDDSVRPNTVRTVSGLGKVTLHKVTKTSTSIEVVMLEIVLSQPLSGLPAGSVVRVGYSYSKLV